MTGSTLAALVVVFLGLTFAAWRRYLWVASRRRLEKACSLQQSQELGERLLVALAGFSDERVHHGLALRNHPTAIDRHVGLMEHGVERTEEIDDLLGRPLGVPRLALHEPAVQRRLAIPDIIVKSRRSGARRRSSQRIAFITILTHRFTPDKVLRPWRSDRADRARKPQ
jgi:hypothetical protein